MACRSAANSIIWTRGRCRRPSRPGARFKKDKLDTKDAKLGTEDTKLRALVFFSRCPSCFLSPKLYAPPKCRSPMNTFIQGDGLGGLAGDDESEMVTFDPKTKRVKGRRRPSRHIC